MGYDIFACGAFVIKAENAKPAGEALLKAIADKDYGGDIDSVQDELGHFIEGGSDGIANLIGDQLESRLTAESLPGGDIHIGDVGDHVRGIDYIEWVIRALAPFVSAELSCIDFEGEDGYKWRWECRNGKLENLSGDTVYGHDIEAPTVVHEIVNLLYDGNRSVVASPLSQDQLEDLLNKIEKVVREGGFGPHAGLTSPLERLAAL